MDRSYLSNHEITIMSDSLFTRFLAHNHYAREMIEQLKFARDVDFDGDQITVHVPLSLEA